MQALIQGLKFSKEILKLIGKPVDKKNILSQFKCVVSSLEMHKGLENLTVEDVLETKGDENKQSLVSCLGSDFAYDAAKTMTRNNIGSLIVLKPGDKHIAGIITERDYLKKIIAQGRSATNTRVAEIMTDENKLITVRTDMNILRAMKLMTDNHIRHAPVIDGRIVGMISIVDVVRTVVEQQNGELKRLNEFIRGKY